MGTHGPAEIHENNHGCSAVVIGARHEKHQLGRLSGLITGNGKRLTGLVVLELLLMAAVVRVAAETPKPHSPCKVNPTKFDGWNAQELSNPWLDLVIVPQLGGRLMQVTFAAHPYLFVNPKYEGQYFPPSQADGKWFNYGGDKLWPMPEGPDDGSHWPGPIADQLDDGVYQFEVLSQDPACAVRLDGPADSKTGLQYSREITIRADSPEIQFHSVMKNASDRTIRWSMQTVSQYNTSDARNPAEYNRDFWALTPLNAQSAYFNGYQVRAGLANDPSFAAKDGMFSLHWLYLQNEVWLDSMAGWLAVDDAESGYAMVERAHTDAAAEYPGKATLIFYKNGAAVDLDDSGKPVLRGSDPIHAPYYMEAEINSPMVELKPGQSYAMDTLWQPARLAGRITGISDAGIIANPIATEASGDRARITGSLGVFYPGKLVALFLNASGARLETVDLAAVQPEHPVQLDQSIERPRDAESVSVHLIDDQGRDCGSLGQTRFTPAVGNSK